MFLFHFFLIFRLFLIFFISLIGLLFFLFLLLLFLLHFLLVAGSVHLVGCKQFTVGFGVLQQLLHHFQQIVGLLCRNPVETEAAGFLALAEEVPEEVVQHVSVPVELQETLRVLRRGGGALGRAVRIQSGYHADLARLLVTDNQHVLFVFFLCHLIKF